MKKTETKAKTVHEAIAIACEELGVGNDQVTVEVLSQGGIFGKAKVLVTVKEESAEEPLQTESETKTVPGRKEKPKKEGTKSTSANAAYENKSSGDVCAKFEKTLAFVVKLLELLENDSSVTSEITEKSFNININGENVGRLIGKGGEVMSALQTLVSSVAVLNSNGEPKRVFINVADYKERRDDGLHALAQRKAEYVKNTGRFVKLDPMNARDRAIIHSTLSGVDGIRTYSTGQDPFRCLCIAPSEKTEKK